MLIPKVRLSDVAEAFLDFDVSTRRWDKTTSRIRPSEAFQVLSAEMSGLKFILTDRMVAVVGHSARDGVRCL